jgi:Tfp pilus assembly protein PilF
MCGNHFERLGFLFLAAVLLPLVGCPRDAMEDRKSHTRVELAKDFLRRGELDAAEVEAGKALAHDPRSADAEYVLGLVAYLRAVNNLRVMEVDDCLTGIDAEALRNEMDAFLADAEGHLGRAVGFDGEHAEAWSIRGSVADQLGEHDAAIGYFEKALGHPARLIDVGVTRANLGLVHFHKNDQVRAAKELRQALQFNPAMCLAKFRLGRVYFARREWNRAAEQFKAVVEDRKCPMQEAHYFLLRTDRELGLVDGAERARAACMDLAPKSCVSAQCRSVP